MSTRNQVLRDDSHSVRRRRLLNIGAVLAAFTGASAVNASTATAGPGEKPPPSAYVPLAEKGTPSGVATLDTESKIPAVQIPDLTGAYARKFQVNAADYATPQLAAAAVAPGGRLFFPAGTYTLTAPIQITVDNVFIDAPGATFVQTSWAQPVFDLLNVSGTILEVGMAQFIGTRAGQGSSVRGSAGYVFGAAVWANKDRNYIRSLRAKDLPVGVHFASWDGSTAFDRIGVGNRIGHLEVEGANFGVLWSGQKALMIEDLYVHDDIDDSSGANPPHAYYCSAVNKLRGSGLTIKKARAENILGGCAFQLKYTDGTSLTGHSAKNTAGLVNMMDCDDLTWDGMSGSGILANASGAISLAYSSAPCKRPSLSNTSVVMASGVNTRVASIWADDAQINGLALEVNHSASVVSAEADVILRGDRGRVRGLSVHSVGTGHMKGVALGTVANPAAGWVIEDILASGTRSIVDAAIGSSGTVRYNPSAQTLTGNAASTSGPISVVAPSMIALSTFGTDAAVHTLISSTHNVPVAYSAIQVKVSPQRDLSVTSLTWFCAVASGNYDIGIIDEANTRQWSKGATPWPAAGKVTESLPGILLRAGKTYRIAFASDNTTGQLRGAVGPVSDIAQILSGSSVCTLVSAAYPLPASLVAGTSGSSRTPLIILGGT